MIELTTGVAFLMSSLYGAGQASATPIAAPDASTTATAAIERYMDTKAIEAYVRTAYADDPILVEIARCESTFRQFDSSGQVVRGRVNRADVGIMQINEKYHADKAIELGYNIYTVEGNVAFGKYLYNKYGAQPWSASSSCWAGDLAKR